jgi:hypothetical protein
VAELADRTHGKHQDGFKDWRVSALHPGQIPLRTIDVGDDYLHEARRWRRPGVDFQAASRLRCSIVAQRSSAAATIHSSARVWLRPSAFIVPVAVEIQGVEPRVEPLLVSDWLG